MIQVSTPRMSRVYEWPPEIQAKDFVRRRQISWRPDLTLDRATFLLCQADAVRDRGRGAIQPLGLRKALAVWGDGEEQPRPRGGPHAPYPDGSAQPVGQALALPAMPLMGERSGLLPNGTTATSSPPPTDAAIESAAIAREEEMSGRVIHHHGRYILLIREVA